MNARKMFARAVAGMAMAVMTLMPGDAFAFLGLFEAEPTKAEMEKMDVLFNSYYKAPDVEEAIAILPSVKKMNKIKPGGIPPMIGFYFGAAKSSAGRFFGSRKRPCRWRGPFQTLFAANPPRGILKTAKFGIIPPEWRKEGENEEVFERVS